MKGELEPRESIFWEKRLEWLEDHAPELLTDYLRWPGKLKRHLDRITQRAWGVAYSMTEERGLPMYEADMIAMTEIIYPETQADYDDPPEDEVDRLPPKTRKKLQRFRAKYLDY